MALSFGLALSLPADAAQSLSQHEKILHALNRFAFGPRPGDVEHIQAIGLEKWIDQQLHPESIPENPLLEQRLQPLDSLHMSTAELLQNYPPPLIVKAMMQGRLTFPADPDQRMMIHALVKRLEGKMGSEAMMQPASFMASAPSNPDLVTLEDAFTPRQELHAFAALSPARQDQLLEVMPQPMRVRLALVAPLGIRRRIQYSFGPQAVVAQDLAAGKLYRAVYSNRQLQEVLTDFWFNHFNVYLEKGLDRSLVTTYERDVIRPHVLGKFEDLLVATAQSPAMLFYLDNWRSVGPQSPAGIHLSRGLNENYGRELMELQTLGADSGYTQRDVIEVARCFTGWTISHPLRDPQFEFNPRMHDDGAKVVLGVRIPPGGGIHDGLLVLHILAHQPATAHFISRELAERFVSDDPPASLVDRMAATFLHQDGDLRAVLETMFHSPGFWSRAAYRSKAKSPLEMMASALRAVNANVDFAFPLEHQLNELGEPLYRKIAPTGYPNSSREWLTSSGLLARMNFSIALANNRIPGVTVENGGPDEGVTLGSPDFQRK